MNTDQAQEVMQTIASMEQNTKAVYDMVEEMGGTVPANKNLENMAQAIATIPTGPSLAGLKKALDAGNAPEEYPIGTEIPDTWNGNENPLIVAQYLDETNNSSYGGAVGVILLRKYVEPIEQTYGNVAVYYMSEIKNYLDTTYLENCSSGLKSIISEISVPYYNGSITPIQGNKWFLMSAYEVCNKGESGETGYEGIMWDYWKQKTGLNTPDATLRANSGRIVRDRDGGIQSVWLRSNYSTRARVLIISSDGSVSWLDIPTELTRGVLPACFIAKGGQ